MPAFDQGEEEAMRHETRLARALLRCGPAAALLAMLAAGLAQAQTVPAGAHAAEAPFDKTYRLQGITFHVRSANNPSANDLEIVPGGLEIDNRPITRRTNGAVLGAEVADLNADGSPEIYVYVASAGTGSHGSLIAYASNRRKSLSEIYLPPLTGNAAALKGYRGRDDFAVVESTFVRRFPIYRDSDTDDQPTGGTRQFQYKLVPGEAGWILRLDRTVEY